MTTQHTPGPWSADKSARAIVADETLTYIAYLSNPLPEDNTPETAARQASDLQICAAAPDLLAALHAIIAKFESDPDDLETMDAGIAIARAAIAKATA